MCRAVAEGKAGQQSELDQDAVDDIMQRLFELRVEVQSNLSDVNIELASVKRKVWPPFASSLGCQRQVASK